MKKITYLFNLTLLVVCTQFVFAENSANQTSNKVYISPAQEAKLELMYPGKEITNPVEPQDSNPNEQNINFTVGGGRSAVEVYFCTDYYASESSWNVFNSDGDSYYDGNYGAGWIGSNACYSELLDLADGAYTITLYDSWGDGGLWAGVYNPGVGTYAELGGAGSWAEVSASFTVGTPAGPDWDEDVVLNLFNLFAKFINWTPPKIPVIKKRIEGIRRKVPLNQIKKTGIAKYLNENKVFSYAIPSPRIFNFTSFGFVNKSPLEKNHG